MKQLQHILIVAACLMATTASAQWQWIDKDGRRVFSDRAPSIDVPEKNILKRPGVKGLAAEAGAVPEAAAAASPAQATSSAPRVSGVDKELADKKKQAEEAAKAKRKADEDNLLKEKVENCARAKQAKADYDSGMRIARTNPKTGEREILDDAARAAEVKRIQSVINSECK